MSHIDTNSMGKRLAYALLSAMVTVAMAVLIAVVFQTWFNDPPVTVMPLDKPLTHPLCPGEELTVHNRITVDSPTLLFSYFSVMDEKQNYNINGTQTANGAIPHPHKSTYEQTLLWQVPELPPGTYTRVLTFRSTDGRENSLFIATLFSIGADCR